MASEKNFLGSEGFVWFLGVVEDHKDPLKLGRVRVRCFGYHGQDKAESPTENLPWAQVMLPTTSASVSEVGETPRLLKGSFVFGFFMDAFEAQHPLIIGSIGSIPQFLADPSLGFNDPDGKYPKYVDEPDTSRLARNEKIEETIVQKKRDSLDKGVVMADGGTFNEPDVPYAAEFPYNRVEQSEAGHVHEVDDTAGKERLHTYHISGTFDEIHPDGTQVHKTVGDSFRIVMKTSYEHVKKKVVTIDEDCLIQVTSGKVTINVANGDVDLKVKGNVTKYVNGNLTETITGNVTRKVSGSVTESVGGSITQKAGGSHNTMAGGVFLIKGATIQLNP